MTEEQTTSSAPISSKDLASLGESAKSGDELNNLLQCSKISRSARDGRTCTKCNKWKPWAEFGKRKIGINGRSSLCKGCRSVNDRQKRHEFIRNHGDGISLELKLVPNERFWSGLDKLLDMICEQELSEDETKTTNLGK